MILRHVEYADAEANVVEDAIHVSLVQLVDECLFWGEAKLGGVYRGLVLLCEKLESFDLERSEASLVY